MGEREGEREPEEISPLSSRHRNFENSCRFGRGKWREEREEEALQLDKALRVKGPLGPQIQVSIEAEASLTILAKQISSLTPDHQKVRN